MRTSGEIEQLNLLRTNLSRELVHVKQEIELAKTQSTHGSFPVDLATQEVQLEQEISDVNRRIEALTAADKASKSLEVITERLEGELEAIRETVAEPNRVALLEEQIKSLAEEFAQTIEQLRAATPSGIQPKLSVIRPSVKLVDANLAYRYADLQSEVNILIGFTSLFLGTFLASGVSLLISLLTPTDRVVTAIYIVVTLMSLFVSFIFGFLSWRRNRKSDETRTQLETGAGEYEVILWPATKQEQKSGYGAFNGDDTRK